MTENDRPGFARPLMTIAEVYGESVSEYRMEAYFAALKGYSIEALERAMAQTIQQNKFFPKPAELNELLAPALANRALLAWHTALEARNPTISVRFEDRIVNEVIKKMGGWPAFCHIETESLPFRQKDFERLYLALAALPVVECCEYLHGEHERTNPGEYGLIPQGGIQNLEGKLVKMVVRLEKPRSIACGYLLDQRRLARSPQKALEEGEGGSGSSK